MRIVKHEHIILLAVDESGSTTIVCAETIFELVRPSPTPICAEVCTAFASVDAPVAGTAESLGSVIGTMGSKAKLSIEMSSATTLLFQSSTLNSPTSGQRFISRRVVIAASAGLAVSLSCSSVESRAMVVQLMLRRKIHRRTLVVGFRQYVDSHWRMAPARGVPCGTCREQI